MSSEKTLEILDLFTMETRTLTVPQMAEMLNLPQSTIYRHLRLLKGKGYVIETNDGQYRLGHRFLEMANIVRASYNIINISLPMMRNVTKEVNETSILTVPSELQAVCLETVECSQSIKVSSERGKILPLYGGASSKAILAYMPEDTVDKLFELKLIKRHTKWTIVEKEKLKENLVEIRKVGYAFSDSEIDEGVIAFGVPIFDFKGEIVASLSVAGPRDRMIKFDHEKYVAVLMEAKREIEKYL